MPRAMRLLLVGLLLWLPLAAAAAEVRATLDRTKVQLGETVTLNISIEDGSVGTPDLAPLEQDFNVLGSSSNTSVTIVNGRQRAQFTYGVALRPKRLGRLTVPALGIAGGQTQPLSLDVVPVDPTAAAQGRQDVFMEAGVEPDHAYVGQQVLYTLRLYFAVNLSSGALEDPQANGVDVRRLGDDVNYETERGGRRYHVVERHYALVPQHAGQVRVGAVGFQGEVADPSDPDSFFGSTSPVTASAAPVNFEARPAPAGWSGAAWLPARELELKLDGLPADGKATAGQPLNLGMSVQAQGLPYEALPALSLPALKGATVYPDKPVTATRSDGQWLRGRRQQNFAVVPDHAGQLVIPEITLRWWNVQTDREETARIPEHVLTVAAAPGQVPAPPPAAGAPASKTSPQAAASGSSAGAPAAPSAALPWRWIALASLALWLLSLIGFGWWRRRRRRMAAGEPAPPPPPSAAPPRDARRPRQAFLAAARGSDPAAQAQALLAWARSERPGLANLGELAAALAAERQREAIAALQRARYAADGSGRADGAALVEAFGKGFAWKPDGQAAGPASSPLPPLYPFKLD